MLKKAVSGITKTVGLVVGATSMLERMTMGKPSENKQLIERLAEEANVKPKKAKRLLQALEQYINIPDIPNECTYTHSHTISWCGYPLCRRY